MPRGIIMLFKDFSQNINPHQAYRLKKLKRQLEHAESYEEWKSIALKIDQESGAQEWKYDNCSPYFDAEMISYRLKLLKQRDGDFSRSTVKLELNTKYLTLENDVFLDQV